MSKVKIINCARIAKAVYHKEPLIGGGKLLPETTLISASCFRPRLRL